MFVLSIVWLVNLDGCRTLVQPRRSKPPDVQTSLQAPHPRPLPSPSRARHSPPGAPPRHPRVIAILNPSNRWYSIQRRHRRPPAAELPKDPVDPRRPLKLSARGLDRPGRPLDLLAREPQHVDEALLLVRSHVDPPDGIPPLHPPRQPRTETAFPVIDQDHRAISHSPKLH
jgi:hypothetical protein